MDVAAFVLSVVSVVVAATTAGIGFAYAHASEERERKRVVREEAADQRERQRVLREEAADERERQRVLREEAAARASLGAQPTAALIGHDQPRAYKFQVKNIGHAAATDLAAVLIDGNGEVVASLPRPSYVGGSGFLDVGEKAEFELPLRVDAGEVNALFLHFTWNDSLGSRREHTSRTEIPVP
jgi:hypothetical protein